MTTRARILVVDDDPDLVDRVTQLLEDDHDVLATTDWGELNRLYFREGVDLVLMDVNLPTLRGDRLAQILRAPKLAARPPILFFSAEDDATLARLVRETGVDGFLSKSARGADLVATLERHLRPRATDAG